MAGAAQHHLSALEPHDAAQLAIDRLTAVQARHGEWDGRYHRLLVAFDGSRASHYALAWAAEIARLSSGRITLVAVTPPRQPLHRLRGEVDPVTAASAAEREVAKLRQSGLVAGIVHARGEPADEILRAARMSKADLILMGASRMPGRRRSLGSISSYVAHRAPVSVLLAKRAPRAKRLLYATDGSTASRHAVAPLLAFLRAWDAEGDVLHVVAATTSDAAFPLNARYEDVAGFLRPDDRVRCLAASGPVAESIAQVAADRHADLVLLGARGQASGIHLALGSVSQRVADVAPASILVVRRSEG